MPNVRWWSLLVVCVALAAGPTPAKEPRVSVVRVACADWFVTGFNQPRYWLGSVYAEVLYRRLLRCPELVVTEPLEARQKPLPTLPQSLDDLKLLALRQARQLAVPYLLTGLLEDKGATVNVTALVVGTEKDTHWALSAEVPFEQVFQPQTDLVVRRFVPALGVRPTAETITALAAYEPQSSPAALALVGEGWRAYHPAEPGAAFAKWRQALADEPGCALAAEALGATELLYRQTLIEHAFELYQRQTQLQPNDFVAHYHLGQALADLARWPEAEAAFTRAMSLRPNYLPAYLGRIRVLLEQRYFEKALMACEGALILAPTHPKILHNKAVALFNLGQVDQAKAVWRRILEIEPDNQAARERLETYGGRSTSPGLN